MGECNVGSGSLHLRVELARTLQRVLERNHWRRSGSALKLDERKRRRLWGLRLRTRGCRTPEQQDRDQKRPFHFPTTSTLNVSGRNVARPPACAGAVRAAGRKTWCVFSSRAMV